MSADHGRQHGAVLDDGSREGIRALRIGTAGLLATAAVQFAVVAMSGSAALFSDALHNLGDVLTTVALWIAFVATRRAADDRYTFGYQRFEDIAGLFIVLAIFASGIAAAYESISHLRSGEEPRRLAIALAAAFVGVVGNEVVAQVKIRAGRRIGSDALIAEGQHSRVDGLTSGAAVVGLGGAMFGLSWTDAVAGLAIALVIVYVGVQAGRPIVAKLADRIDPAVVERVAVESARVDEVLAVHSIRARFAGRGLYVLLHIELEGSLTLEAAHEVAESVRHRVLHSMRQIVQVDVHLDPVGHAHHELTAHHFDGSTPADHDHHAR